MSNQKGQAKTILIVILAILTIGLALYLGWTIYQLRQEAKEEVKVEIEKPERKIVVKQTGGAALLAEECSDKNYISNAADYIVEGTVEKVESKWNEERTLIFTYTDMRIEKYVKGEPLIEDKLQIVTEGGRVGEIGLWVEDQPIFHEGKKVRIYFQETNGEFSIVCAHMGVEEI